MRVARVRVCASACSGVVVVCGGVMLAVAHSPSFSSRCVPISPSSSCSSCELCLARAAAAAVAARKCSSTSSSSCACGAWRPRELSVLLRLRPCTCIRCSSVWMEDAPPPLLRAAVDAACGSIGTLLSTALAVATRVAGDAIGDDWCSCECSAGLLVRLLGVLTDDVDDSSGVDGADIGGSMRDALRGVVDADRGTGADVSSTPAFASVRVRDGVLYARDRFIGVGPPESCLWCGEWIGVATTLPA